MLHKLPTDVIVSNILNLLDGHSLIHLSIVSKYFNYLIHHHDLIWKKLCIKEFNISSTLKFEGWQRFYKAFNTSSKLYIWGENYDGRLGLPQQKHDINYNSYDINRPFYPIYRRGPIHINKPHHLTCLDNIIDISVGAWSFHALDNKGRIWTWGVMQDVRSPELSLGALRIYHPTLIHTPIRFRSISSGREHVIGLAQDGTVWHWSNTIILQQIKIDQEVIEVTAHPEGGSSLLTAQGQVYQVPKPDLIVHSPLRLEPTEASLLELEERMVQVVGLRGTVLCLSRTGKVWMDRCWLRLFGKAESISGGGDWFGVYKADCVMLGTVDAESDTPPIRIPELDHQDICKITFGDQHFGALTNGGKVLTWGSYSSGALGQGKLADSRNYAPKVIDSLCDKFVYSIGFGGSQSVALVVDK